MQKAINYSKAEKKRLVVITAIELHKIPGVIYIEKCGPREFIRYFMKADTIFTNSFHGISFSIILNKIFFFEYLESKHKTNSRLKDIIAYFGLEVLDSSEYEIIPTDVKINFSEINMLIKTEKEKSLDYLKKVISKKY